MTSARIDEQRSDILDWVNSFGLLQHRVITVKARSVQYVINQVTYHTTHLAK